MTGNEVHNHGSTEDCVRDFCPGHPQSTVYATHGANLRESGTEPSVWEQIRELGAQHGFKFDTITLEGSDVRIRATGHPEGTFDIQPDGPEQPVSDFGKRVLGFLETAGATYKERNAVYQDNFRVVGKVMEALFPNGAPSMHDHHDYNRWHIFELIIVKLTRYVANWENPDRDSLVDLLPYASILAAQDDELRDQEQKRIDHEIAQSRLELKLRRKARAAGLHADGTAPNYEADIKASEEEILTDDDGLELEEW